MSASPATFNLAFQGQNIISATLMTLTTTYGLGSGDSLLLAGCSAGARGVMVNLDRVAALAPTGVAVAGLLDRRGRRLPPCFESPHTHGHRPARP